MFNFSMMEEQKQIELLKEGKLLRTHLNSLVIYYYILMTFAYTRVGWKETVKWSTIKRLDLSALVRFVYSHKNRLV